MSFIDILLPPLIGGIIGWTTNAIAIWMLFHPYREWRIFGFKLPFTPGVIPSRIEELSESIAKVIVKYIFTKEEWLSFIDSMELDEKAVEEIFKKIKEISGSRIFMKVIPLKSVIKEIIRRELRKLIRRELRKVIIKASEREDIEKDLEDIIKKRIVNEFSPDRVEDVVKRLCKKEFQYIMLFGGLLGCIIGLIQLFLYISKI